MEGNVVRLLSRGLLFLALGLILGAAGIPAAAALKNPADVYCSALGYQPVTQPDPSGGEVALCRLPDGNLVDGWKFLQGMVAPQFNYCSIQGLEWKTVNSSGVCKAIYAPTCSVCVLPDGTEREVTQLMNLSFQETSCGDWACGYPENSQNCPRDCPASGRDVYCEEIRNDRCDPDCAPGMDPDCAAAVPTTPRTPLGAWVTVAATFALAVLHGYRRR